MEQVKFYLKNNESDTDSTLMNVIATQLVEIGETIKEKYDVINTTIKAFEAITEEPIGIKQLISFAGNDEIDRAHLRSIALAGLYEGIQKDPSLITFQRSLLTLSFLKLMYKDFFKKIDYN